MLESPFPAAFPPSSLSLSLSPLSLLSPFLLSLSSLLSLSVSPTGLPVLPLPSGQVQTQNLIPAKVFKRQCADYGQVRQEGERSEEHGRKSDEAQAEPEQAPRRGEAVKSRRMEDREARRARQAAMYEEKRARLEAQIRASTDFIFGGGQQPQADRHVARFRPPAPPRHHAPAEALRGTHPPAVRSFDFVACERCLLPVRQAELDEHQQRECQPCRPEERSPREEGTATPGSEERGERQGEGAAEGVSSPRRAEAEGAGGSNMQASDAGNACVICLEEATGGGGGEEGVRCSGGGHMICSGCLDPYVGSLVEESDIFRARGAKIVCPMSGEGCTSSFRHRDLALHVSHETFERSRQEEAATALTAWLQVPQGP
eukprot:754673-Hanusia_phi.AAC.5